MLFLKCFTNKAGIVWSGKVRENKAWVKDYSKNVIISEFAY